MILIKLNELYDKLGYIINYGFSFLFIFIISVFLDKLVLYKDGKVLFMLKGVKGFGGYEGFEIVGVIELIIGIMNYIVFIFNYKLVEIYYEVYVEINCFFDEN